MKVNCIGQYVPISIHVCTYKIFNIILLIKNKNIDIQIGAREKNCHLTFDLLNQSLSRKGEMKMKAVINLISVELI